MLIDRTHTRWIVASVLILLVSLVVYVPYSINALNGPSGDSWTGLTYGIIGSFFILIAGGIGVRKKIRTWRLGKAQTWLRAHIWLGLLSFPMILFHCGFDFGPRWALAWVMMWMFIVIIISGIFGLVLQHLLPRVLTTRVRQETVFEQIDYVVQQLRWEGDWLISGVCGAFDDQYLDTQEVTERRAQAEAEAEHKKLAAEAKKNKQKPPPAPPKPVKNPQKLPEWLACKGVRDPKDRSNKPVVEDGSAPLKDFYLHEVQPYLLEEGSKHLYNDVKAQSAFGRVRTLIPPALHETLQDLENISDEHRMLVLQRRVHKWLHYWLLVHGPVSWAMIFLSAIHGVVALYY